MQQSECKTILFIDNVTVQIESDPIYSLLDGYVKIIMTSRECDFSTAQVYRIDTLNEKECVDIFNGYYGRTVNCINLGTF